MKSKLKLFITYLPRIRPFSGLLVITFISDISLALITMLPPLFSVAIFDYAYQYKNLTIFNFFIIAGLLIYFINIFLSASIDYINEYVDRQIEYDLSNDLFSKIESLPLKFHTKGKIGDLMVRLTNDVYQIVDLITGFIPVLLVNLAKLGFFLFITFKMDFRITILALCSVPLYLIEMKFFSDKLENIRVETQKVEGRLLDCIQEKLLPSTWSPIRSGRLKIHSPVSKNPRLTDLYRIIRFSYSVSHLPMPIPPYQQIIQITLPGSRFWIGG